MRQATYANAAASNDDDDALWIFAVSRGSFGADPQGSGENILALVDTGADDHMCPETFAVDCQTWAQLGPPLYDAQGGITSSQGESARE